MNHISVVKLGEKIKRSLNFSNSILEITKLAWQTHPIIFSLLIVLQFISGLIPIGLALITKAIFDLLATIMGGGSNIGFMQSILPLLFMQVLITLMSQILEQGNTYLNSEMGRKLQLKSQSIIYQRINELAGIAYFENPKFYDTMQIASQGLYSGPSQILYVFTNFIRSFITLMSFLGTLLFLSPLLAFIVIIASIPQLIVQLKFGRQQLALVQMNNPKERKLGYLGQILSSVNFAKEVRLFNLSDYLLKQFIHLKSEVQRNQRNQELKEMRWMLFLALLSLIVSNGAFLVVIWQAFEGRITIGDILLYNNALGSIQGALSGIIFSIANLNQSILFFSHFKDLMNLPSDIPLAKSPKPIHSLSSSIEIHNISFRYTDESPWILKNLSLSLHIGTCTALVGLNGAGKTTLVKLMLRLYDPTEGQILWDGIDIREFEVTELRERMTTIFQDFIRYDFSVQDNIGIGNIKELDNIQRIEQSAKIVKAHDFIKDLPQNYQTILSRWLVEGEAGTDLSGGQWQKIAMARMFMRDADFLILDEPTAALDAKSEYEIFLQFKQLVQNRTSLLISHRFSTVRLADYIAVLENGEIVEYGTHDELLAQGNTYAKLYGMQVSQYK